jgi:hypothetical protein
VGKQIEATLLRTSSEQRSKNADSANPSEMRLALFHFLFFPFPPPSREIDRPCYYVDSSQIEMPPGYKQRSSVNNNNNNNNSENGGINKVIKTLQRSSSYKRVSQTNNLCVSAHPSDPCHLSLACCLGTDRTAALSPPPRYLASCIDSTSSSLISSTN